MPYTFFPNIYVTENVPISLQCSALSQRVRSSVTKTAELSRLRITAEQ